jgi:hypothetical protein
MPPGCLHAVATLSEQGQLGPTIMRGFHFLSAHSLELTLEAAMRHSLWHNVWANITHDDADVWRARILALVALILGHDASCRDEIRPMDLRALPVDERNLFSLLFMAENYPYFLSHSNEAIVKQGLLRFNPRQSVLASWTIWKKTLKSMPLSPDFKANMLGEARNSMQALAKQLITRLPPACKGRWEVFREEWVVRFALEADMRETYWLHEELDAAAEEVVEKAV